MSAQSETYPLDDESGPDAGSTPSDPFTWVVPGKVIAMSRPSPADVAALRSAGVTRIMSLTLRPLSGEYLERHGIANIHIPMADMTAPCPDEVQRFVDQLTALVEGGHKVAVHCGAGLGRTGTMLACYLVACGLSADEAVRQIRRRRPGSVESAAQERAVSDYETHLRSSPS